ncbi:ATP-binding protein [Pseudorhodobacter turbinis]|uniref:hybrid sensor histidine kinase/response regulator n=1 Tax=Pseudorhodobacter turbinis TaxID=2500533 RepID=UPI00143DC80E|nr:ATP-binding protein [Pseudorhodobacter turbinis]
MARALEFRRSVAQTARELGAKLWLLLAPAVACLVVSYFSSDIGIRQNAAVAGITFAALVVLIRALVFWADRGDRKRARNLQDLVGNDATPCFSTDELGVVLFLNAAAKERFSAEEGSTLASRLNDHFASPSSVLFRLQNRARNHGAAREDVVTRRGHTRLSVHALAPDRFLWRLEEFVERPQAGRGAEMLSLPMLVANKSGVVLFANDASRRLLGARPKRLDRVFNSPVLRSGEEVEVASADGPVRAILAEVTGAGDRREIYLLPVRERPDGTEMVADFENLPIALIKFRADGSMRSANAFARDLTKLGSDDLPVIHDLFEGLGRSVADWMDDVLAERVESAAEVMRLHREGSDVFVQVALRRIVDNGRPGVLAILQDATALKTLEAQFAQSQKMQAIGQLAGGIAHDFNNLLTAISGHCDLLLLRHNQNDPEYADLVQIHQNVNRAASLVGQLLAFSRKQTLKPEHIDLQDVLSDMTHLLNRLVGERVKLSLNHGTDLGMIRADKRQLEQVLMNLVVNARDAMTEGGVIRVETEALTLAKDMPRERVTLPAGAYSIIRVIDEGCGIKTDLLQKIFEPFVTTKGVGKGTGLGLSTVYGIVKQSGGFVFVESELGKGSTFTLYFPVNEPSADATLVSKKSAAVQLNKPGEGIVLLVEDEAPVRAFASRALRLRGYTVLEAENAEVALKMLEDRSLEVDVFVTDVVMPGMDGPAWVREALRERPDVRVVFVSGYAEDCLSENQARIPNSVFLPKPFSLNDLATVVQGQMVH